MPRSRAWRSRTTVGRGKRGGRGARSRERDDGSDSDAVPEREEDNRSATDLDHEPPAPVAGKRPRRRPTRRRLEDDPDAIVQPGSMPRAPSRWRARSPSPVDAFKAEGARSTGAPPCRQRQRRRRAAGGGANGSREPLVPKVVDPRCAS